MSSEGGGGGVGVGVGAMSVRDRIRALNVARNAAAATAAATAAANAAATGGIQSGSSFDPPPQTPPSSFDTQGAATMIIPETHPAAEVISMVTPERPTTEEDADAIAAASKRFQQQQQPAMAMARSSPSPSSVAASSIWRSKPAHSSQKQHGVVSSRYHPPVRLVKSAASSGCSSADGGGVANNLEGTGALSDIGAAAATRTVASSPVPPSLGKASATAHAKAIWRKRADYSSSSSAAAAAAAAPSSQHSQAEEVDAAGAESISPAADGAIPSSTTAAVPPPKTMLSPREMWLRREKSSSGGLRSVGSLCSSAGGTTTATAEAPANLPQQQQQPPRLRPSKAATTAHGRKQKPQAAGIGGSPSWGTTATATTTPGGADLSSGVAGGGGENMLSPADSVALSATGATGLYLESPREEEHEHEGSCAPPLQPLAEMLGGGNNGDMAAHTATATATASHVQQQQPRHPWQRARLRSISRPSSSRAGGGGNGGNDGAAANQLLSSSSSPPTLSEMPQPRDEGRGATPRAPAPAPALPTRGRDASAAIVIASSSFTSDNGEAEVEAASASASFRDADDGEEEERAVVVTSPWRGVRLRSTRRSSNDANAAGGDGGGRGRGGGGGTAITEAQGQAHAPAQAAPSRPRSSSHGDGGGGAGGTRSRPSWAGVRLRPTKSKDDDDMFEAAAESIFRHDEEEAEGAEEEGSYYSDSDSDSEAEEAAAASSPQEQQGEARFWPQPRATEFAIGNTAADDDDDGDDAWAEDVAVRFVSSPVRSIEDAAAASAAEEEASSSTWNNVVPAEGAKTKNKANDGDCRKGDSGASWVVRRTNALIEMVDGEDIDIDNDNDPSPDHRRDAAAARGDAAGAIVVAVGRGDRTAAAAPAPAPPSAPKYRASPNAVHLWKQRRKDAATRAAASSPEAGSRERTPPPPPPPPAHDASPDIPRIEAEESSPSPERWSMTDLSNSTRKSASTSIESSSSSAPPVQYDELEESRDSSTTFPTKVGGRPVSEEDDSWFEVKKDCGAFSSSEDAWAVGGGGPTQRRSVTPQTAISSGNEDNDDGNDDALGWAAFETLQQRRQQGQEDSDWPVGCHNKSTPPPPPAAAAAVQAVIVTPEQTRFKRETHDDPMPPEGVEDRHTLEKARGRRGRIMPPDDDEETLSSTGTSSSSSAGDCNDDDESSVDSSSSSGTPDVIGAISFENLRSSTRRRGADCSSSREDDDELLQRGRPTAPSKAPRNESDEVGKDDEEEIGYACLSSPDRSGPESSVEEEEDPATALAKPPQVSQSKPSSSSLPEEEFAGESEFALAEQPSDEFDPVEAKSHATQKFTERRPPGLLDPEAKAPRDATEQRSTKPRTSTEASSRARGSDENASSSAAASGRASPHEADAGSGPIAPPQPAKTTATATATHSDTRRKILEKKRRTMLRRKKASEPKAQWTTSASSRHVAPPKQQVPKDASALPRAVPGDARDVAGERPPRSARPLSSNADGTHRDGAAAGRSASAAAAAAPPSRPPPPRRPSKATSGKRSDSPEPPPKIIRSSHNQIATGVAQALRRPETERKSRQQRATSPREEPLSASTAAATKARSRAPPQSAPLPPQPLELSPLERKLDDAGGRDRIGTTSSKNLLSCSLELSPIRQSADASSAEILVDSSSIETPECFTTVPEERLTTPRIKNRGSVRRPTTAATAATAAPPSRGDAIADVIEPPVVVRKSLSADSLDRPLPASLASKANKVLRGRRSKGVHRSKSNLDDDPTLQDSHDRSSAEGGAENPGEEILRVRSGCSEGAASAPPAARKRDIPAALEEKVATALPSYAGRNSTAPGAAPPTYETLTDALNTSADDPFDLLSDDGSTAGGFSSKGEQSTLTSSPGGDGRPGAAVAREEARARAGATTMNDSIGDELLGMLNSAYKSLNINQVVEDLKETVNDGLEAVYVVNQLASRPVEDYGLVLGCDPESDVAEQGVEVRVASAEHGSDARSIEDDVIEVEQYGGRGISTSGITQGGANALPLKEEMRRLHNQTRHGAGASSAQHMSAGQASSQQGSAFSRFSQPVRTKRSFAC